LGAGAAAVNDTSWARSLGLNLDGTGSERRPARSRTLNP